MYNYREKSPKLCRWCGSPYVAFKPPEHDGFCSPACKQAHYRAYKKYVTRKPTPGAGSSKVRVTHPPKRGV